MEYVIAIVLITIFIYVILNVGAASEESFRLHMQTASQQSFHVEDNLIMNGYANRYQFVINGSKKLVHFKQDNQILETPFTNIINADLTQGDGKEFPKASSISICIHLRNMDTPSLTIDCYQDLCCIQSSNSETEYEEYRESLEKAQDVNSNCECSNFGNWKCSKNGNKNAA